MFTLSCIVAELCVAFSCVSETFFTESLVLTQWLAISFYESGSLMSLIFPYVNLYVDFFHRATMIGKHSSMAFQITMYRKYLKLNI